MKIYENCLKEKCLFSSILVGCLFAVVLINVFPSYDEKTAQKLLEHF